MTGVENAKESEEKEELELVLDLVEEGVGVGEGVKAGEDITLSLCVPCEFLSFRLRNLLMVLMLGKGTRTPKQSWQEPARMHVFGTGA